jgi:lipopolysaccharide export system protein LptA
MRPILIAISPLLALLLALPAQAKQSDYQQPVEVDSVRQLAELNANRVTSNELRYQLKQRLVILTRNAEVKQEDNKVSGDLIRYDIEKQQIVAESSGGSSRVKTIFLPQQVGDTPPPAKEN